MSRRDVFFLIRTQSSAMKTWPRAVSSKTQSLLPIPLLPSNNIPTPCTTTKEPGMSVESDFAVFRDEEIIEFFKGAQYQPFPDFFILEKA